MEGQESTEAFDFAFGPVNEYLDVLRTLTLKGKARLFMRSALRSGLINQLRLIKGFYGGQENVVSELLKVGAPAEISPLFTFRTFGVPHHPRVSSWPLRALLEARALGLAVVQKREAILRCRTLIREWEHDCVAVHCKRDLWSAFSAKCPDGRSVWRHATRDVKLGQTGSKRYGGLSGVFFWRCGRMIGSLGRKICEMYT